MKLKKLIASLLGVMVLVMPMVFANGSNEAKAEKPVELIWYTRFDDQADTVKVNEALNKLTMEKIGCTVKINNIPGGTYNDKMQVIIGGREECDIIFSGSSFADFWGNASRGAFLPLNELLQEYGKEAYAAIPESYWEGVSLNGKIYGLINYQIEARQAGWHVPEKYLKEFDFDLSKVNNLEDMEPFFAKFHAKYPDMITTYINEWDIIASLGYDEIGANGSPGAVLIGDDSLKVVNQYETAGFLTFVEKLREWYLKGYIISDAATIKNFETFKKAGKMGSALNNTKPGGKSEQELFWGVPLEIKIVIPPRILSKSIDATLNCISSTSKHPVEAMKFLNLLNTDKDVYNLMSFGIEGVHYKKIGDNRIEFIDTNKGYKPNKAWAFGNQFNAYLMPGQDDNVWSETISLNESASVSQLLGFVFNPEPVKNYMAQCQSVWDQYYYAIMRGTVDPVRYIPEFVTKLNNAGAKEIIAEKQKQIDAWKVSK
jgi:putative aldouronate transport system substrate-binding protein